MINDVQSYNSKGNEKSDAKKKGQNKKKDKDGTNNVNKSNDNVG